MTRGRMPFVRSSPRPRRSNRLRPAIAVVCVVAIGLAIGSVALLLGGHRPSIEAQRNALRNYASAAQSLAQEGGGVVQQAMKPAVGSLQAGSPDRSLPADASGWADQMQRLHDEWRRLVHPQDLETTHRLFVRALAAYVSAARDIAAAARGSMTVVAAIRAGQTGDRLWDQAAGRLRREFLRLGLTVPGWVAASQPA